MPDPDASWSKLQQQIGGATALVPSTLGGLLTALAGTDPSLGPEIDGRAPAYFAAVGKNLDDAGWALSLHLRDVRHARAVLAIGDAGHFAAKEAHGMTMLVPDSPSSFTVAIDGDRVVLAKRESDLDVLGAYASRTLPREDVGTSTLVVHVPPSGMTALSDALAASWKELVASEREGEKTLRDKHGGKEADFADTEAVLAIADEMISARANELSNFASALLTVDAAADGLHGLLLVSPKAGQGPAHEFLAGLALGDASPLLSSWADARASILVRTTPASRVGHASAIDAALERALGQRLTDAGKKELKTFLHGWESGVGDVLVVSVPASASRSALLGAEVKDEKVVRESFGAVPLLFSEKALASPFGVSHVDITKKEIGAGSADITSWASDHVPPAVARVRPPLSHGVGTLIDGNHAFLAFGEDPLAILTGGVRPERKLGDDHLLGAPLAALGEEVSVVAVLQPLKLELSHLGEPAAPAVVALGKRGEDAMVRADLSLFLLKGLIKKAF